MPHLCASLSASLCASPASGEAAPQRGADMSEPPELDFAWLDRDGRIDLAVDRDDLALVDFGMLDEQKPFRQALQNRKQLIEPIDDKAA